MPKINASVAVLIFSTFILATISSQPCFAEAKKIGSITFSVNQSVGATRARAFAEHDVGNRLVRAITEKFKQRNLIDPGSKRVLNLNINTFRLRNAITLGLFGFVHTGKDRLYYWVDLKAGDRTERLFQSRVTTLKGWLFFPSTNGRIERMIKRVSRDTVNHYERSQ